MMAMAIPFVGAEGAPQMFPPLGCKEVTKVVENHLFCYYLTNRKILFFVVSLKMTVSKCLK